MRVLRGRREDPKVDHRRTREMADRVAETGDPALRVWTPPRQVVFGRRDRRSDGYERARGIARDRGYATAEREVGGRAVAFTGETVAFSLAEPVDDHRTGIQERYDRTLDAVRAALADCGVETERGEPSRSFCPGSHSLQVDDGKVVGVAQRVRRDVAVAGGVLVRNSSAAAAILAPVYDALGVPFDRSSVGNPSPAGGSTGTDRTVDVLESALADGRRTDATRVRET